MNTLSPDEFWYKEAVKLPKGNSSSYGFRLYLYDFVFRVGNSPSEVRLNKLYHSISIF